ncbi:MAG: glutathione S-transferase C-terminal domain-containing protein [Lachnospiraceae bacterium]|nr:glutathione S-transferase C-terminal domain-containing protein [Lachnospiraceae bacterium]
MEPYDYEVVNGKKIRVRPRETISEIDANGYFRRQPNHFTTPFGDGEKELRAEGNGRYRLVWAKLCHWSNRASIVRELEGLEDQISINMVGHAPHEKNLGWEYIYNKDNKDPILGDQFLSEAYYRADENYQGRTTVPALIDTVTGKVVNNDYNWLTNYLEVAFRPWHKESAPELYPKALREEIDKMNLWLFDNINNAVYRSSFSRSNEGHFDGVNTFYAAMDRLEKRLETKRFLFGDYVTDSDVRLYVTLARLDIRYTNQLGETKHPLYTYKNLWGYARELWSIPAFKNNTFFADFAVPPVDAKGNDQRSFNFRFLKQIDFKKYWGAPADRSGLSKDPKNIFLQETDAGTARKSGNTTVNAKKQKDDAEIYHSIHSVMSTEIAKYTEEELPTVKVPEKLPEFKDDRAENAAKIIAEIRKLPDGPELVPADKIEELAKLQNYIQVNVTDALTMLLTSVKLDDFINAGILFYGALEKLEEAFGNKRFLLGDYVSEADVLLYVSLVRFDVNYSRYLGAVKYRVQDFNNISEYLKDLYQIPAFAAYTDFGALIAEKKNVSEKTLFRPSTHYDLVLPRIDFDAQWKVPTERAYLSEDPTHPIWLADNRRFSLDPTWYELGAETLQK